MNFIQGKVENGEFLAPGITLKVPPKVLNTISTHQNNNLILGIRPEHFSTERGEDTVAVDVKVEASEFLGDRSLVFIKIGESELVASLKHYIPQARDTALEFNIDMKRVHFFDPESEKRIRKEGGK